MKIISLLFLIITFLGCNQSSESWYLSQLKNNPYAFFASNSVSAITQDKINAYLVMAGYGGPKLRLKIFPTGTNPCYGILYAPLANSSLNKFCIPKITNKKLLRFYKIGRFVPNINGLNFSGDGEENALIIASSAIGYLLSQPEAEVIARLELATFVSNYNNLIANMKQIDLNNTSNTSTAGFDKVVFSVDDSGRITCGAELPQKVTIGNSCHFRLAPLSSAACKRAFHNKKKSSSNVSPATIPYQQFISRSNAIMSQGTNYIAHAMSHIFTNDDFKLYAKDLTFMKGDGSFVLSQPSAVVFNNWPQEDKENFHFLQHSFNTATTAFKNENPQLTSILGSANPAIPTSFSGTLLLNDLPNQFVQFTSSVIANGTQWNSAKTNLLHSLSLPEIDPDEFAPSAFTGAISAQLSGSSLKRYVNGSDISTFKLAQSHLACILFVSPEMSQSLVDGLSPKSVPTNAAVYAPSNSTSFNQQ